MRWAGDVARMGEISNACSMLVEKLKGRDQLQNLGIDGNIILEWILGRYGGKVWTGFIWLMIGTSGGVLRIR
jgi:hypothetical protein